MNKSERKEYAKEYYKKHKAEFHARNGNRVKEIMAALKNIALLPGEAGDIARTTLGVEQRKCPLCGKTFSVGALGGRRRDAMTCSAKCRVMKWKADHPDAEIYNF